jgi:hypothetical protein
MFSFHGVGDTAHFYLEAARNFFNYRNMLFLCRINGVFNRLFHGLAATDKLSRAGMKDFYDIATDFAFINLKFLGHTTSFWFV